MAKIIEFPKNRAKDAHLHKLKDLSDQMDQVVLAALREGVDPHEIAGLLAHRLGTLIRPIDHKSELWTVCEKVLKKQASLE